MSLGRSVGAEGQKQKAPLSRKAEAAVERKGTGTRMHGEVFQSLSPCSIDQRSHQETSQAIISMLACDVHALEKPRQPLPVLRAWDPLNDDQPGHPHSTAVNLDEERHMGAVMFGNPIQKILSEPIRVSLFISFDCPPDPSQPCKFARIRQASSSSGQMGPRNGWHLNSLYLRSQQLPVEGPNATPRGTQVSVRLIRQPGVQGQRVDLEPVQRISHPDSGTYG
jgi:hypothetical protein